MRKKQQGVSPVIGVLLLLGITVGFVALTSNIVFDLFDSPTSPTAEIEITHDKSGSSVTAEVLIVRNRNIDEFSYIIDGTQCYIDSDEVLDSGDSFIVPDQGVTLDGTDCSSIVSLDEGDSFAVRSRVGSELFVLDNYRIPNP